MSDTLREEVARAIFDLGVDAVQPAMPPQITLRKWDKLTPDSDHRELKLYREFADAAIALIVERCAKIAKDKSAEYSEKQRDAFLAGRDVLGTTYHGSNCAAAEVEMSIRALSPSPIMEAK